MHVFQIRKKDVDKFNLSCTGYVPCVEVCIMAGENEDTTFSRHIKIENSEPDLSFDILCSTSTSTTSKDA